MQPLAHFQADEPPTRPTAHIPASALIAFRRIGRLAELASERLSTDPDADAILEAIGEMERIREICAEVGR